MQVRKVAFERFFQAVSADHYESLPDGVLIHTNMSVYPEAWVAEEYNPASKHMEQRFVEQARGEMEITIYHYGQKIDAHKRSYHTRDYPWVGKFSVWHEQVIAGQMLRFGVQQKGVKIRGTISTRHEHIRLRPVPRPSALPMPKFLVLQIN